MPNLKLPLNFKGIVIAKFQKKWVEENEINEYEVQIDCLGKIIILNQNNSEIKNDIKNESDLELYKGDLEIIDINGVEFFLYRINEIKIDNVWISTEKIYDIEFTNTYEFEIIEIVKGNQNIILTQNDELNTKKISKTINFLKNLLLIVKSDEIIEKQIIDFISYLEN